MPMPKTKDKVLATQAYKIAFPLFSWEASFGRKMAYATASKRNMILSTKI